MKKSFTLLELVIVIVIIGILATLGLSQYYPLRERALSREATANLRLIRAAERIYRMESNNAAYGACQCSDGVTCNSGAVIPVGCNFLLKLSLNTQNWTYAVTATGSGSTAAFTATAGRQGSGGYLDCQWSIDQAQDDPVVAVAPCMQ